LLHVLRHDLDDDDDGNAEQHPPDAPQDLHNPITVRKTQPDSTRTRGGPTSTEGRGLSCIRSASAQTAHVLTGTLHLKANGDSR
jgi:hypothetical protein